MHTVELLPLLYDVGGKPSRSWTPAKLSHWFSCPPHTPRPSPSISLITILAVWTPSNLSTSSGAGKKSRARNKQGCVSLAPHGGGHTSVSVALPFTSSVPSGAYLSLETSAFLLTCMHNLSMHKTENLERSDVSDCFSGHSVRRRKRKQIFPLAPVCRSSNIGLVWVSVAPHV